MPRRIRNKWVKALRSGEYLQGDSYLKDDDGEGNVHFCCLGVLQAVTPSLKKMRGDELLSEPAAKAIGLTRSQQVTLARMNDAGDSFCKIADYIEAHL